MIKKYFLVFSVAILLISFTACGQNKEAKIDYHTKTFKKLYEADSMRAVDFNIEIIELDNAPTPAAKDSINKYLNQIYNAPITGEYTVNSVEELYDSTLSDFKREVPSSIEMDYPYNVALDRKINIVMNENNVFSFTSVQYQFTGGAHGMTYFINYNFDATSGKQITFDQLFNPGKKESLRQRAEKYFRSKNNLGPNDNLEEEGFWFENNRFALNENFLLEKDSLSFMYNQYEIAPYAFGQFEIKIPYSDIKNIINKDGALKFVFEKQK